MTVADPFAGPAPAEVPLPQTPLLRVIGQVRFPPNLAIDRAEEVSGFQKFIRSEYPVLQKAESNEIMVSPNGDVKVTPGTLWRFFDAEENWYVSLTTTFVALETKVYTNRADFLRRFRVIIEATNNAFHPQVVERLGLRYVNRVREPARSRLASLIRPEMLGIIGSPVVNYVRLNMAEAHIEMPDAAGQMLLRYGMLPSEMTYEPTVIEPINEPSWILDIDTFRAVRMPFDPQALSDLALRLADRTRRMFRWVVNEEFLRAHGATL